MKCRLQCWKSHIDGRTINKGHTRCKNSNDQDPRPPRCLQRTRRSQSCRLLTRRLNRYSHRQNLPYLRDTCVVDDLTNLRRLYPEAIRPSLTRPPTMRSQSCRCMVATVPPKRKMSEQSIPFLCGRRSVFAITSRGRAACANKLFFGGRSFCGQKVRHPSVLCGLGGSTIKCLHKMPTCGLAVPPRFRQLPEELFRSSIAVDGRHFRRLSSAPSRQFT